MTPKELKLSILSLAFQGKLVAQNKEEGTGTELLERLLLEKRFEDASSPLLTSISDEETPFDIPTSWVWVRNKIVAHFINGRAYKKAELKSSGKYPVLRVGNLFTNSNWYFSDLELPPKNYCDKGDLLYSWSASFGPAIWNGQKSIFHYHIWKLDSSTLVDTKYLYYALLFDTEKIRGESHGLGFVFVTKKYIEERIMPLPPLAEQKRIVEKIESLMSLVDEYERVYNKLQVLNAQMPVELEKSVLQFALTGKLVEQKESEGTAADIVASIQSEKIRKKRRDKGRWENEIREDEIPFEIPSSWVWCRLGAISSYDQPKQKIAPTEITDDLWSLDLEDIEKGSGRIIAFKKAADRKITGEKVVFKKGQVLYSKLRPYLKKILVAPGDGICTPELVPFDFYGGIDPHYIVYVLKSPHVDYTINAVTYGVKMPRVGTDTMLNLLIPLPPLEEQRRIVKKLDQLLLFCLELQKTKENIDD